MLTLVSRGIGWTITRALAVLQNPEKAKVVTVLPLPAPELARPIYLVTRNEESPHFVAQAVSIAQEIFKTEITPQLEKIAPWLVEPLD